MKVLQQSICFFICLFLSLFFISCSSGSSSNGTQNIADVRKALVDAHGEEGGFDALMAAFSKGYSLRQIVDGALSGQLMLDGNIGDSGDGTLTPAETATGSVVGKDIQIVLESRFLNLNTNFLQNVGVDFDFEVNPIDIPLELRETGHSVMQIFEGIDGNGVNFNNTLNVFGVQSNTGFLLNSVERQNVVNLINLPNPEAENENENIQITEDDILIEVSPTVIQANHFIGQTQLPQRLGVFSIINSGTETIQVEIGQTHQALNLTENGTILLNGLESINVGVDFNGNSQVPFTSEIPIVGRLFRNSQPSNVKRNLMIFVTAQLIQPGELE